MNATFRTTALQASVVEFNENQIEFSITASESIGDSTHTFFDISDTTSKPNPFRSTLKVGALDSSYKTFLAYTIIEQLPAGVYSGMATLRVCFRYELGRPSIFGICDVDYANSPILVPYQITVQELMATFSKEAEPTVRAMQSNEQFAFIGFVRRNGNINQTPLGVTAEVSPPFGRAQALLTSSDAVSVSVSIPANTPAGLLTGNLTMKICKDNASVCASPYKNSPIVVPISIRVQ